MNIMNSVSPLGAFLVSFCVDPQPESTICWFCSFGIFTANCTVAMLVMANLVRA